MRSTGFGFSATDEDDTVTVKIQLHWEKQVPLEVLTDVLTHAYAEAFKRATEAVQ